MTTPTTETTPTTPAAVSTEAPEAKLDFVAAAAQVWKDENPPVQETIQTTGEEQPEGEQASKDTPAEETKTEEPKPDRVASRIAAAKRAEQKAEQQRLELRAQREQQERRQAELDAREKRLRVIEEDPVKFFEEFKADPKTFLEKLAGEYKPENVATKKLTAVEEELKQLREEISKRDAATKHAQQRAQADSAWKAASAAFIAHVGEQAEKYQHLTEEFTEDQATELAFSVLTETVGHDPDGRPISRSEAYRREFGEYPDHDVVAEHLNTLAQQRVEARSKSAWRKRGDAAAPGSEPSTGDLKPVPSVSGTSPRTLKARDGSTRASPPKVWTQEAADEESLRILSAALRKQA